MCIVVIFAVVDGQVDSPPCHSCGNTHTRSTGGAEATADERAVGASRVEAYQCTVCLATVRC